MREILFRGKYGEEWVYGVPLTNPRGQTFICKDMLTGWDVEPETVGQWAGLKDKNGVKIFEGDILRLTHESEESIHEVRWYGDKSYPAFDMHPDIDSDCNGLSYAMAVCTVEVIGNIHDLEKANKMKVGNLNQHCGDCNIMEYCGNPYGYCLCADVRFSNVDESEYKRIAETAKVKKYEACKDCDRPDCGVYWYNEDDCADEACEHEDNARNYYCEQVADHVWSSLDGR